MRVRTTRTGDDRGLAEQPRLARARRTPVRILQEVARLILDEPRRYNQGDYIRTYRSPEQFSCETGAPEERMPPCGTVCCVAGWVATLTRPERVKAFTDWNAADGKARLALGLDHDQAGELFDGMAVSGNPGTAQHARNGVRHIERFMRRHLGYRGGSLLQRGKKR
jgi:hypothetical protein